MPHQRRHECDRVWFAAPWGGRCGTRFPLVQSVPMATLLPPVAGGLLEHRRVVMQVEAEIVLDALFNFHLE